MASTATKLDDLANLILDEILLPGTSLELRLDAMKVLTGYTSSVLRKKDKQNDSDEIVTRTFIEMKLQKEQSEEK